MTKMTVLHFASPFSVTMPVHAAARGSRSTGTAGRDDPATADLASPEEDTTPFVAGADSVSWLAMDGPVTPVPRDQGSMGLLDKVRRRYAEHLDPSEDDRDGADDTGDQDPLAG